MKHTLLIKRNLSLLFLMVLATSTARSQADENDYQAEAKRFFAPAMSWVRSKLQPGEKIIADTLFTGIRHDASQATEFNYKKEKLNRTVYVFSKKGETNGIWYGATDTAYHAVDLPDNVWQKMQTAAYDVYKISFTGPLSTISYAVSLPHPKSLEENNGNLFSYLPGEKYKDSVICIRVICTVRPDTKGWAANQKYFDEWAGKLGQEDADIAVERQKNDANWVEFKTMADEIKRKFNTLYESAKKNNGKFYQDRELSDREIADAIIEVTNDFYELNKYMAGNKTKTTRLSGSRPEYKDYFNEAISSSNKIYDMVNDMKNEMKKASSEKRKPYSTNITRNLYDIQLTASHMTSLSY